MNFMNDPVLQAAQDKYNRIFNKITTLIKQGDVEEAMTHNKEYLKCYVGFLNAMDSRTETIKAEQIENNKDLIHQLQRGLL